ncbi:MAG: hypothetical protein ACPGR2_09985 [Psychrobium sp.]
MSLFSKVICILLLVVSTLQTTAAAMMTIGQQNMTSMSHVMSNASMNNLSMNEQSMEHCQQMMQDHQMTNSMALGDCTSDCDCCGGVCPAAPLFIDLSFAIHFDNTDSSVMNAVVTAPIYTQSSLYRPPIIS